MATAGPLDARAESPSVGKLATDSLAVGIAFFALLSVLQRLVGFGRSLIFCHLMTDEELGRWSLSFSFLVMAGPFAVMGLPGSFGRYFEHYHQRGQTRAFLRKVLTLTVVLTLAFFALVLSIPGVVSHLLLGTPGHADLIRNLAVALLLVVAMNVATELATAMRQVRLVSILQFIHSILFALIACGLLMTTSLADRGVVLGYAIGAAVAVAIAVWMLCKRVRDIDHDREPLGRSLWSRLLPFAAWMWVSNVLFNLFDTADRLMIVHYLPHVGSTDALVGQYHSSRVIPTLLVALSGMLAGVILPYVSEDWERGDRLNAARKTLMSVKVCALLFVFGGALVLMMAPILFGTLLQGRYDAGLAILPCTMVYCIWFGLTILAENHLFCAERARSTSAALLLGLIVNLSLNAILLPRLGLVGAVTATAIANGVALGATLLFAKSCGLGVDRHTVAIVAFPLVLLAGWQWTIAALLVVVLLVMRQGWMFDSQERQWISNGWDGLQAKLGRSV